MADDGRIEAQRIDKDLIIGKRADQVLASPAFGLVTSRNPGSEGDLSRYAELFGKRRNDAEETELNELSVRLRRALSFGESEFEQMVEKAVAKALEELTHQQPSEVLDLETKKQLRELFRELWPRQTARIRRRSEREGDSCRRH